MYSVLKKLYDEKKSAAVYSNSQDTTKFSYGRILALNNEYVILDMFSPHARYDGFKVLQIDCISRVEADTLYNKKMDKLCESLPGANQFSFDESDLIYSALEYTKKFDKILYLELCDSGEEGSVGFVDELGELCKIRQVSSYGEPDGYSYIDPCDITYMLVDAQDEQIILKLFNENQSK